MSFRLFIHYQSNNVGHVKCYTWRIYTSFCMAPYKGLLCLMSQRFTSDCINVLQGVMLLFF